MIELLITSAAARRLRFAVSPLEETLGALRVLLGRHRHPVHLPWLAAAAGTARELPLAELARVLGARRYITEFLGPPPQGRETTAEAQLAELRSTPPAQVARELAMVDADLGSLPRDPARARDLLADQMELAWTRLVAPQWPRLAEVLAADIDHRARLLAAEGFAAVLAELHPRVALVAGREGEDTLVIDSHARIRTRLDARGLLLVPSVFAWPAIGVVTVPPWQPTLIYPARGVGALWERPPGGADRLAAVLGRTKAALLETLSEPGSTSRLAARLGLSPGTVSEHLTALRGAGLLTTTRRGREVVYRRSPLGDALLAGGLPGGTDG
ncbi:ArsR/SmtB family transcription factor [Streptomyces hoynatensis]|uniref:ArsR family transcriptional regulator n=1 Tax=Streptomyces hoynatensis TaxID=1141874 RepID=A0A3A9ZF22_9ACTN|nr:DUF5937 family protein [Streptomyces hoynatensis]RKN46903.1 ArsR family transcriptional regulator [Streptomyces hoynatensis]